MPPPPRRPYKRISPRRWEQQKDRIRELFIDQGKTHEDVIRILREDHGFGIGLRQLKRKTEEWGFVKNIPNREMEKMLRKRKRRQEELGKATKFMRRHGGGEFQDVSEERLDSFQKRFRLNNVSSMSTSTGTPSNIIYHTPSNGNGSARSNNPGTVQSIRQATIEFNNSVEQIFSDGTNDGLGHQANSPSLSIRSSSVISSCGDPDKIYESAANNMFNGDYRVAGQKFHLVSLRYADMYGSSHWLAVSSEFDAAVMKAAEFAGCPQSIVTRIVQEQSHFLMRERQKYIHANRQTTGSIEHRKTLTCLKMNARWLSNLIAQQRAIQIWEPVLGSEHPKVKKMHDNIAVMRVRPLVNPDKDNSWIERGASVEEGFEFDNTPQLNSIADLLHLEDGSPNDLLEKFRALENSDITSRKFQEELALLRYGRSRSMLGGYYSFLGRYDDAEKAFQESGRYMKYEVCIEIKLHRILWYAEHETRTRDWDRMGKLISQAHEDFMKNESPSKFIVTHFPDRFKLLCMAASKQVPIDEVVDEPINDNAFERLQTGNSPASIHQNSIQGSSLSPNFISSPERLFPLTPGGFNSAMSVDIWRQFVHFPENG